VKKAAAIAAVSESTKRDLIQLLAVSPDRVTVVPNAADDRFFIADPLTPEEHQTLGLPDRFLLCVGTLEPRKNHLLLFDALESIDPHRTLPLVIAGGVGWSADGIVERARALERSGRVMLLNYVDDQLLPRLYASATAVMYPSWYEGFGLPVLEGLAAGRPVIASDVPAHKEVAGDEAVYVRPDDVVSMARAIIDACEAEEPTNEQIEGRRRQAKRYSWESSGAILAQLLSKVATP
jgi:glycosyltransferase involved in cell wall biosynthesis